MSGTIGRQCVSVALTIQRDAGRCLKEAPVDEKPDTTPEMESEIGDDDLENVGGGSVLRIDGTGVAGKSVAGTGIAGMDNNS